MHRRQLIQLAAALSAGRAGAQVAGEQPARYSILSLIGNRLSVITAQMQTGSLLDRNQRQEVTLPDGSLDLFATQATQRELLKHSPQASAELLVAGTEVLYKNPITVGAGDAFVPSQELSELLKTTPKSHLILLTKHRAEALLRAQNSSQGHGMLEGLGFYVDFQKRMRRSDTGETGQGYMGIFANIQIWLLDCENNKVVREVSFSETTTYSAARSETANDPWTALDGAQKLARLKSLMRTGIARSLPKLLQA